MNDGTILANNQPMHLFTPGSWFAKIDFINHLILFKNVLITVLSEEEGGKTSFARLLQDNLDQQIKSQALVANPGCDKKNTLEKLAHLLQITYTDNTSIADLAAHVNASKSHMLIVIDDAQHLPNDFIQDAVQQIKNQDDFSFFHLCLLADGSLLQTLHDLEITQSTDLMHSIELGALNEHEMRIYILQRLIEKRLTNKIPTDRQFKELYHLTKGNLCKINHALDAFLMHYPKKERAGKLYMMTWVFVFFCTAVVLKTSYVYFNGDKIQLASQKEPSKILEPSYVSHVTSVQLASQIPVWQDKATTVEVVHFELPKLSRDLDDDLPLQNTVALVDKVVVIPTVKPPAPKVQVVAKVIVKPAKQSWKPYTIQLLASHKEKELQDFKRAHHQLAAMQIRHLTLHNEHWYVLTLGAYKSKIEAQTHAKKLPTALAKLKPWIRKTVDLG